MIQKFTDRRLSLCRSMARQMAIRPGISLKQEEMQQLIADLFCCLVPGVSPSGRKTMAVLNPETLLN